MANVWPSGRRIKCDPLPDVERQKEAGIDEQEVSERSGNGRMANQR